MKLKPGGRGIPPPPPETDKHAHTCTQTLSKEGMAFTKYNPTFYETKCLQINVEHFWGNNLSDS